MTHTIIIKLNEVDSTGMVISDGISKEWHVMSPDSIQYSIRSNFTNGHDTGNYIEREMIEDQFLISPLSEVIKTVASANGAKAKEEPDYHYFKFEVYMDQVELISIPIVDRFRYSINKIFDLDNRVEVLFIS